MTDTAVTLEETAHTAKAALRAKWEERAKRKAKRKKPSERKLTWGLP